MLSVILALFVVILCFVFFWNRETNQKQSSAKQRTIKNKIPGPEKGDKDFSNFIHEDLHIQIEFIQRLNKRYGPVASFWDGDEFCVSIALPELLKETRALSLCPDASAAPFRILTGGEAYPFKSHEEILRIRKLYEQHFTMKAVKTHFDILKKVAEESAAQWKDSDRIPLLETVIEASQKAILIATFGETFADDEKRRSFKEEKDLISKYLGITVDPENNEAFQKGLKKLREIVRGAYEDRRKELENGSDTHILIDVLLEGHFSESERDADGLMFFLASGTTTSVFIQLIYFLIIYPEYQDKVYEELKTVLGENSISLENYSSLTYLRQVIDEGLRMGLSFHTGRKTDKDMIVGEYLIPKGTAIYQNLGACNRNPNQWKNPDKFDPDNFSPENSKGRHPIAFKPFGFAGKRICPGMNFAMMFLIIFTGVWFKKFKFSKAPGEEFVHSKISGFNYLIEKEVQLLIAPRN